MQWSGKKMLVKAVLALALRGKFVFVRSASNIEQFYSLISGHYFDLYGFHSLSASLES